MAQDRSRRLCFCLQFGASVTFASSRRHIVDRVRRATSVWSHQPRVLYGSYDGRVQKHYAPSLWSRDITVQRIKSFGTRSVQKAKEATSALQEQISRKVTQQVSEKWTCYSFCAAFIAFLFLYINLLLAGYAGGGLAAAARLWWDPTTYVVGRELDAHYFELTRYGMPAAAAGLLLLTVLAALAMHARRRCRRVLLVLYAILMAVMAAGEAVLLYWVYKQSEPHLEAGREHLKELVANTREVLDLVAQYHDFTDTFRPILEEIEKEEIVQVEIMTKMVIVLGVLQVLAVVLALVAAYYPPGRRK